MIGSKLEFGFIKQCFDNPQLWAVDFQPIDPIAGQLINLINQYKKEYGRYPTYKTFFEFSRNSFEPQQTAYIKEALNEDLDEEFVARNVLKYVEEQKFRAGLVNATTLLDEGKIAEAKSSVVEGMEMTYKLPVNYRDYVAEDVNIEYVSTGYNNLDKTLGGGGHRTNLILIIAPKSVGKSLTMLNIGSNVFYAGGRVMHITLEDSQAQVMNRYNRRHSQLPGVPKGDLYVQEFFTGTATVADFDASVNAYRPDLVIVDYINEIGVVGGNGNRSQDLGIIARNLRAMSQRYNNLVLTAQQGQKHNKHSKHDTTAEDGYWSYEPAQVSDVVITLNQTEEEKHEGKLRVKVDRNKNGPDGLIYNFDADYANMMLREC